MTDYTAMNDGDVDKEFIIRVCRQMSLKECNHCCRHEEPAGCRLLFVELKPEHFNYMRQVLKGLDEREEAQP